MEGRCPCGSRRPEHCYCGPVPCNGQSTPIQTDNQQRASEVMGDQIRIDGSLDWKNMRDAIAAALDAAEQRGRDSVGLGDFLPDPCGDEHRARASHIAETYGDWLSCTLRRGHGGEHEHEDSGVNWPASTEAVRTCERCRTEDAIPAAEHGLCAYCVHYNDGRVVP